MSHHRFNSSRSDSWISPRQPLDPSLRALAYGPIRSMDEPSGIRGWLERVFS